MANYKYLDKNGVDYLWKKIKNNRYIYAVKGTQTSSTNLWTGNIDVDALYDGLTIAYYLPTSGTTSAATLNLTLSDNTQTGAISVYETSTMTMTNRCGAGSTILLTYWSAGSISVNGTATTNNRWTRVESDHNNASTSVYGFTKLSTSTSSTSTSLAATPSAVKAAYDLANGKSTVSISNLKSTGTKIATVTINGTGNDVYVENMTGATSSVAGVGGLVPTPAAGDQSKFLCGDGTWQTPANNKISVIKDETSKAYLLATTTTPTTTAQEVTSIADTSVYLDGSGRLMTEGLDAVSSDNLIPAIVGAYHSYINAGVALTAEASGSHGLWSSTPVGSMYLLCSDGIDSYIYTTIAEPASNTTLYPIAFFSEAASDATKKIQHNDGLRYLTQAGTTSAVGQAYLVVGNATASGTAGNKKGIIRIYSQNTGYYQLDPTNTSSNVTLTLPNTTGTVALDRASFITEAALTYSDTTSWHKFAQFTSSTATEDRVIVFIVSSTYYSSTNGTVGAKSGILIAHVRTTSTKALSTGSSELTWLVAGSNINNTHFKMLYYNLDSSCRIELWCKVPEKYVGWSFNVIEEHSRTSRVKAWTLYTNSSSGQAGVALPTDASGSIDSTYQSIKNPYVS